MKALAGPAMLLILFGGYAIIRMTSGDKTPSRDFTDLELASDDAEHSGTCYALGTVLVANGMFGNAVRTWSAPEKGNKKKWLLTLERVIDGRHGPEQEFQKFTFEQVGEQVRLTSVDASEGVPTEVTANIDRMLHAPHGLGSTPVDRCAKPGATGYQFPPK